MNYITDSFKKRVEDRLSKLGYELISIPDNYNPKLRIDKIHFKDSEGYLYYSAYRHISDHKPYKFGFSNIHTIENIKLWLINNDKPFELVSGTFINATEPMQWKCKKCGKVFELDWNHIHHGEGCRHCKYDDFAKARSIPQAFEDSFEYNGKELLDEWDYELNTTPPSSYKKRSEKKVWWKCPKCNQSYQSTIRHRMVEKSGCPNCNMSHGETEISKYLNANGILFVAQQKFEGCKNKRYLPFDFFLPQHNLCIEFQGEQHYRPYDFASYKFDTEKAIESFDKVKKNDQIKKDYCNKNGITLLEVPYTEIRKIPEFLNKYLMPLICAA